MSQSLTPQNAPIESDLPLNVVSFPQSESQATELVNTEQQNSPAAEVVDSVDSSSAATTEQSDLQTPEQVSPKPEPVQNTDWFTLAGKLRQQNRELIKTIVKLEQALAESEQQLQMQIRRSRSAERTVAQQAEEINKTQQQFAHLISELETTQETCQNQKLIIENLSEQLQSSQEQLAKLQRECAIVQEDCQQKTQKVMLLEQQVRELRSRLLRQQRYTIQYKSALERYLDTSVSPDEVAEKQGNNYVTTNAKTPSIQPWSINWGAMPSTTEYAPSLEDELSLVGTDSPGEIAPMVNLASKKAENLGTSDDSSDDHGFDTEDSLEDFLISLEADESEETRETNPAKTWHSHLISQPAFNQKCPPKTVDLPNFLRSSKQ